jgi:hypothetical protein
MSARRASRRTALGSAAAAFLAALFIVPGSALAGPVILGGDDLTDHGSVDAGGNNLAGWLYIEKALKNLKPNVTRANDAKVAALGSGPSGATSGDAGAAIGSAAPKAGLTVDYRNGEAAIRQFFLDLAAGTAKPAIIWIAGDGANNDIDSCSGAGTEGQAINDNASAINNFVNQGGGLMAHKACYGWLSALLPGLTVPVSGGDGDLFLTPEGTSAFPGLTNGDINSGPWHNHFEGDIGGLQVLVRSSGVMDSTNQQARVIIGGGAVSIVSATGAAPGGHGGNAGNGGNGGPGPNVTGTGGPGGNAGPCGGGGAGGGGLAAGGGGAGGGGCFDVVGVQSLASGAIAASAGVVTDGSTIRAEVFDGAAKRGARRLATKLMPRLKSGRYNVIARLSSKAWRRLNGMRKPKVTLRLTMLAPTGLPLVVTRTVKLKR